MMNHFERTAIFTVITNIEQQLQGLKTLLAASGQQTAPGGIPAPKRVAHDPTSLYTNEQEDRDMDRMLDAKEQVRMLELEAERRMQEMMDAAAKANAAKANAESGHA